MRTQQMEENSPAILPLLSASFLNSVFRAHNHVFPPQRGGVRAHPACVCLSPVTDACSMDLTIIIIASLAFAFAAAPLLPLFLSTTSEHYMSDATLGNCAPPPHTHTKSHALQFAPALTFYRRAAACRHLRTSTFDLCWTLRARVAPTLAVHVLNFWVNATVRIVGTDRTFFSYIPAAEEIICSYAINTFCRQT